MGAAPSKPAATVRAPVASTSASTRESQDTIFDEKQSFSPPKSSDGSLTVDNISAWESTVSGPVHTLARTVMPHSPITSLQRRQAEIKDFHVFNTEVPFKTSPVANQRYTGRCWLFASTNVLRYSVMQKAGLKEFELSQVSSGVDGDFFGD